MNILSPPRARLQIDVVFDLVCPWCFLGTRRLRRTLRARPDIAADITWRPFLLNPDIAPGGVPRQDYIVRKFGGEDRARRLHATIAELGRGEGLIFNFDLIRRIPPSLDAHRLVRLADQHGVAADAVDTLFQAYFCEGQDIGDIAVLASIGATLGMDEGASRRLLSGPAEVEAVHADNLRAHRLGINGVPCFVVQGRHAIAGAQEPEVIERLLDVAVVEG
ncbi:DsbA family oxidoreductase [Falsiroseomonas stagni]|uniref:Predicted dithiol-disulfide isomerase, DsbA family n=1 Tax=Falsiroseomonas stagni DSM 19981 TaxID=1123062 RepID=A0A1I4B0D3_9PROT|nr:DsbA family oxidoreductase [Falsiroseomonas stagni]SFK61379.1 Predicted dithiol-disulfide isomerase, DsbA family [Falsiroseomonas stagni DSM 19981]